MRAQSKGIEVRHQRTCRTKTGGKRCNCEPSYRAYVWDTRAGKLVRRSSKSRSEAEGWHGEATVALRRGTLRTPSTVTVREAADAWLEGARDGSIRNRSHDRFKPSTIRGYERSLNLRVLPELGHRKLSDVRRSDVQDLVDRLLAGDASASTIRNTLDPLRSIYRRAVSRDEVAINPTAEIELPANRGRRDRAVEPADFARLLAAMGDEDRALWATAGYAGLRRGELRGLRWEDVDLAAGLIRVERGWDDEEGEIEGKTRAARRTVPLVAELRRELVAHKLRTGRDGSALVFGLTATRPFYPSGRGFRNRIAAACEAAGIPPVTLHECRHTFASFAIAAGVNAKALSTYMGHADVGITLNRYGHLFPGNESEAANQLDRYLADAGGAS